MAEEEKQKVIEAINKRKPELRAWLDRDAWKDYDKDDKCGYKAWYVDEENGIRSIKSQILIKKPMKEIYDYVVSVEKKSTYDHKMDHAKLITKFDDTYELLYFNYKIESNFSFIYKNLSTVDILLTFCYNINNRYLHLG